MKGKASKKFGFLAILLILGLVSFFGVYFIIGYFNPPGVVYYDESLNGDELTLLESIFTDEVKIRKDLTISASESSEKPITADNEYLYQIKVPVTNFYDARTDISEFTPEEYKYIPIEDLDFTQKLLAVNGEYYLDTFDKGAVFRTITFDSPNFSEEIAPLVENKFSKIYPDRASVLTFAQTGVTALSREMNTKIAQLDSGKYFAEKIGPYLASFDFTHTSNESSFTNYATSTNICSDFRFEDTLLEIGLDIVELTGNHNLDCGITAAIDTINWYDLNHIKYVGGGKDAADAAKPVEIDAKDTKITLLAYNQSTGGATMGSEPGANQYSEENAVAEITAAKAAGNFVIVDIQYYECSMYDFSYENITCDYANSSAGDQIGFFRHLIDLGADLVVGTSAHQPQTFEQYGNGAIYYGLGNLFFDQYWWPGTTRSLILAHYFHNGKLLQTKIVPTVYDSSMQTTLLDKEGSKWFIERLASVHP